MKNDQFKQFVFKNFFAIASVLVVLANLWLASRLYPLAEGISNLTIRVSAAEKRLDEHADLFTGIDKKLETIIWELGKL